MGRLNKKLNKKMAAKASKPIKVIGTSYNVKTTSKIGKKARRQEKSLLLHEKLKSDKESKARAKVALSNMKTLNESLKDVLKQQNVQTINNAPKEIDQDKKSQAEKSTKKLKRRKKDFLSRVKLFTQIAKHPDFQKDSLNIISEHLEAKIEMEKDPNTKKM